MTDIVAVPCTRRHYKEMVDGTVRCPVDIEPYNKRMFDEQFPEVGEPCYLISKETLDTLNAALTQLVESEVPKLYTAAADVEGANPSCGDPLGEAFANLLEEQGAHVVDVTPKGGELAKLAGQFCNNPDFFDWIFKQPKALTWFNETKEEYCARSIRHICCIKSRAELDHNAEAAKIFHKDIRIPFMEWQSASKNSA